MKVGEALRQGIHILKNGNVESPASNAGVLLCYVLKCSKTYLYTHSEDEMEKEQYQAFLGLLKRRGEGMPLQYLTGCQEFMSLEFKVTPDVLIPRQDTEVLVEAAIDCVKGLQKHKVTLLDIGTGSGCIAISLAHYLNSADVTAVDVSQDALEVAQGNALTHEVEGRIQFLQSDLFERISEDMVFDMIVSNPPYIPKEDIKGLEPQVKDHEPLCALDGGEDGLGFYRRIIAEAPRFLYPGGILGFEVGYGQAWQVAELMSVQYDDIRRIKDLGGIERVVIGKVKAG